MVAVVSWRFLRPRLAPPRRSAAPPQERERQQLHTIGRVGAVTHCDCGATRLAFGEATVATRQAETAAHAEALRAFQAEVARQKPEHTVAAGIINLDGSVEAVS